MHKLIFLLLLLAGYSTSVMGTPRIEIHHIGAGDGDATLFIILDETNAKTITGETILDTVIILIDGERSGGGAEVWRYLRDTVNKLSPLLKRIDYLIVSHLHYDHFGGITKVINSAKEAKWAIKRVYDRQNADYKNYLAYLEGTDTDCYGELAPETPTSKAYPKYINALTVSKLMPTKTITPLIDLLASENLKHISMHCVVANGQAPAADGNSLINFLLPSKVGGTTYYTPKSENDLSLGFILEFQGFHYLTMGDLGGKNGGNYRDGETPVTNWLYQSVGEKSPSYHICALKVSHHGSAESTTATFVATNKPTVSIIQAALKTYGTSVNPLPTQDAITSLNTGPSNTIFYTFVPKNPTVAASFWKLDNLQFYNDVVLKVTGLPGETQNVTMELIESQKRKSNGKFIYNGVIKVQNIICAKGHDWD